MKAPANCPCGGVPTLSETEGGHEAICHGCYDGGHDNYDDGPSGQMHTSGHGSAGEAVLAWNDIVAERSPA